MRRILKRVVQRDSQGAVIHEYAELTVDNGRDIGVLGVETLERCESCRRPIKPDDPRGMCQVCGRRTCSCGVACAVCSRNVCGDCRRGVISAQVRLTVCPICLPKAERVIASAQELAIENAKAQLLHASLLDRLPGIGIVRQVAELKLLRKLDELEEERHR